MSCSYSYAATSMRNVIWGVIEPWLQVKKSFLLRSCSLSSLAVLTGLQKAKPLKTS